MSDTAPITTLPIRAACQVLGITPSQYYDWRNMKLLDNRPASSQVSEREAMQLAVLHLLSIRIGGAFGRIAYRQIRQDVIATIGSAFEIVWVEHHRSAVVVRSDGDLVAAAKVDAPILVIRPKDELVRMSRAWERELEDRRHNLGSVKRSRQRRKAHQQHA